jgi:threonine/homoserine/homoserine lactone efflux protein
MGDMIGQMLPSAVGVAISPFPIVAVVLMLVTAHGRVNGLAFILGWVIGLAIVGAVLLSVASGVDSSEPGEPATGVSVAVLVLGLLLLLVALKRWRGRPHEGDEAKTPKWMEALDKFSPIKAAGAGVVLSALNPKNLLLAVAGAAAIARTGISTGQQVVAYVVFVLIATIGVGAPVLIYLAMGDRSRAARPPEELAGPEQRRDHGRALAHHRRQADWRWDLRPLEIGWVVTYPTWLAQDLGPRGIHVAYVNVDGAIG